MGKIIKYYHDSESLYENLLLLNKTDKDLNCIISRYIVDKVYPLTDTDIISNSNVEKDFKCELLYNMIDIVTKKQDNNWSINLNKNSCNMRTDKYCSFGWNKIVKDGKESYRVYLTLYGKKTSDAWIKKHIDPKVWHLLEERNN